MAKIILKNGNTFTKAVCPRCECEFLYQEESVETMWNRITAYESEIEYTYVICPECGKVIKLDEKK